jgi:Xaa-Pro aminopeptidase
LNVILTAGYGIKSAFRGWWKINGPVGFDSTFTTYEAYQLLQELQTPLIALKNPLKSLREKKEPSEIGHLTKAAMLCVEGFDYVTTLLQEGISEREIVTALEIFWLQKGGERVAFTPHIAFGEGSSQPHYHSAERRLKKGDSVLIDIGVVTEHYNSDMTRVVAFGEPAEKIKEIYQYVWEAYQAATELCRPGVKIREVDRAARGLIEKKGFGEYFPHGLGHGVGLEIHEAPRIHSVGNDAERVLEEGMVLTIEPGIYLPGIGGVRLEDTLLITITGFEILTVRPLPRVLPIVDLAENSGF